MASTPRLPTVTRRRQIAAAALRIISTQGVRRMTAAALAAEVGITDGTIFRHFKNKDEIAQAAIDLFEETLGATYPPPGGEPLARLGAFLVSRLTLVRENPQLLRLAFNDRLEEAAGEAGAARVSQLVGRSVNFVRDCLAEAQSRGEITRETPLTLLVWMVIGVVRGAATAGAYRTDGTHDVHHAHSMPLPDCTSAADVWRTLERFLRSTAPARHGACAARRTGGPTR